MRLSSGDCFVALIPRTEAEPLVGASNPVRILNNVVFPAPLGPATTQIWPRSNLIETSSSARMGWLICVRRKTLIQGAVGW